ncbi:carboxypeptidase regulatory-like domain-containing protein [Maribrevibacterium harenarium]|nr:carboxypeptidase regulatory-like domain-containing protein [Maribrevibacterium harenarium]
MAARTFISLTFLTFFLVGCGGSGSGDTTYSNANNNSTTQFLNGIAIKRYEADAQNCEKLDTGIDKNANGVLDDDEVQHSYNVCSTPTFKIETNVSDTSCANGATRLHIGVDSDANGILSVSEISQTHTFCQGAEPEEEIVFSTSNLGVIAGKLPVQKLQTLMGGVATKSIKSQTGDLWLTPNDVALAIQANEVAKARSSQASDVLAPVSKAVKIPVADDGSFQIEVPAGAEYSLSYTNQEEGVQLNDIAVSAGTMVTKDIETTDLTPLASIEVAVQDLDGNILPNASIEVLSGAGGSSSADENGLIRLEQQPAGMISILIAAPGYVSQLKTISLKSGENEDITLQINALKGKASGQVQATLLDNLANILVYARDAKGNIYTSLTNSAGTFEFPALPVGEGYSFIAFANDLNSAKIENVTVEQAEAVSVGTITLTPVQPEQGSFSGYALFEEKMGENNHAGIIVSVEGTDKEAITSRDGAYVLNGLTAGDYTLNFTDSSHITVTKEKLTVVAGGANVVDAVELKPIYGAIKGKLVDQNDAPIANAQVTVLGHGYAQSTDTNGQFEFINVPIGSKQLQFTKNGYQGESQRVLVEANETTTLSTIELPEYSFTFDVSIPELDDLSGVQAILSGEISKTAVSNKEGRIFFSGVNPGNYQISLTRSGVETLYIPVVLPEDQPEYVLPYSIELKRQFGHASGNVTLLGAANHSGVKVTLADTNYSTYTDALGNWTIAAPIGNYQGITYSKRLFNDIQKDHAITLTEFGVYAEESVVLQQQYGDAELSLSAVGSCSTINVDIKGTSDDNKGFAKSYVLKEGETALSLADYALGSYRLTASCEQGGWETVSRDVVIGVGQQVVELESVNLRQSYLKINEGAAFTNKRVVDLEIGSSDAAYMQITDGVVTSEWQAFSAKTTFELSAANGVKDVKVSLKDINDSPLSDVRDSIELDTVLNVNRFTTTTRASKGDALLLNVDLNGEKNATVKATISGLVANLPLVDNGSNGDEVANDGIYSRRFVVTTSNDFEVTPVASIVDKSGNSISVEAANSLVLSTSPSILNVDTSSNLKTGKMTVTFETDEVATSFIEYGSSVDSLDIRKEISIDLSNRHKVDLTGLAKDSITFYRLTASDNSGNRTVYKGQGKLAPPPVEGLSAFPGHGEVGLAWDNVDNASGYEIYRSEDGGTSYTRHSGETPVKTNYYLDALVINGQAYQYRVLAIDEDGNLSEHSSAVAATPSADLAGPTQLEGGVLSTNTIWLASRSPYQLSKKLKISEGVSLSLLPGTQFEFAASGIEVQVDGQLNGYGTESNRIGLTAEEGNVGLFTINSTNNTLACVDISHINITGEKGVDLSNASINGGSDFNMTLRSLKESNVSFNQGRLTASLLANSEVKAPKDPNGYHPAYLTASTIRSAVVENLAVNSDSITDSSLDGSRISTKLIENSVVKNGQAGYQKAFGNTFSNTEFGMSEGAVSHFNFFDSQSSLSTEVYSYLDDYGSQNIAYDLRWNYWEPKSGIEMGSEQYVLDVMAQSLADTRTDKTWIFPLLTSTEMKAADWDQDTIPDYLDHDSDNDGYSDLQEYLESDLEFEVVFNPLDDGSKPETAQDADMDGIADESDLDNDNDGLSNTEEEVLLTSQWLVDSDADGIDDATEVKHDYDPTDENNLPLAGVTNLENIAKFKNSTGVVLVVGNLEIRDAKVSQGIELKVFENSSISLKDSVINASKELPFIITGSRSTLSLSNTILNYSRIKANTLNVDSQSSIYKSDVVSNQFEHNGFIGESFLASLNGYGYSYSDTSKGVIDSSYIFRDISNYNGEIRNSYIASYEHPYYFSFKASKVKDSFVASSYSDCYSGNSSVEFLNSIVLDWRCEGTRASFINSDIILKSNSNAFVDGSYIQLPDGSAYTELGSPVDQNGDGEATTEIPYSSGTIKVDGINALASAPIYGAFDLKPYQTLEGIWDPTNVGVWWDMNNPNQIYDSNPFQNTGTLKGKVLLPGAKSHAGTQVRILNTSYVTETNSLGEWSFDLPARVYSRGIVIERDHMASVTIDRSLTITAGDTTNLAEQTMTQLSAEVSGNLIVDNVASLADAQITLTQGSKVIEAVLAPNGYFTFDDLSLGEYDLLVTYPGGTWESFEKALSLKEGISQLDLGVIHLRNAFVYINNEASYTNTAEVELDIVNGDASKIQIAITENGARRTLAKESYSYTLNTKRTISFNGTDGAKTVEVEFFDAQDQSLAKSSASIVLDRNAQIGDISLNQITQLGDALTLTVATGESGGQVMASVNGLFNQLALNDQGLEGDEAADDGIYTLIYKVDTADEVNAPIDISFTDRANNQDAVTTAEHIVLQTAPVISNVLTSTSSTGMTLTFETNEPTTVMVKYGANPLNLDQVITITEESQSFSLELEGDGKQYFTIEVDDGASDLVSFESEAEPSTTALEGLKGLAGSGENGLIWHEVTDADHYRVYRSVNNLNFTLLTELPSSQRYFLDQEVSNGQTYDYRVTWLDSDGKESDQTRSVSLTPLAEYAGPTEINGAVMTVDTLWLGSRSPYQITNNVLIQSDASLNLLPGTQVEFIDPDIYMLIRGNFNGLGDDGNPVSIVSEPPTSNFKSGLLVDNNSSEMYMDGYSQLNTININLNYSDLLFVNIENYDEEYWSASKTNTSISNSTVVLNSMNRFRVSELEYSSMKFDSYSYYNDSNSIMIGNLSRSIVSAEGVLNISIQSIENSSISNVTIYDLSSLVGSELNDVSASGVSRVEGSVIKDSNINSNYSLSIKNTEFHRTILSTNSNDARVSMRFSILDIETSLAGFEILDVSQNYWGSVDVGLIAAQTGYVPDKESNTHLYPIITSADVYNADWDNDGIPDYRDNDNDGDGYSDLQEDWSSAATFGVIYDPIDAGSHPDTELDNDMDGIPDSSDQDDDGDGLTDEREIELKTNPFLVDSDGDGADDSIEIGNKYDPLDSNHLPITKSLTDEIIDSRYENFDGDVILAGPYSVNLVRVSLKDSVKIKSKETSLTIMDSVWDKGVDFDLAKGFYVNNSTIINCDVMSEYLNVDDGSIIRNCDIKSDSSSSASKFNYGLIEASYINMSIYNAGRISRSYISKRISNSGDVVNSTVKARMSLSQGGSVRGSFVQELESDWGGSNIFNSILNMFYGSGDVYIEGSDVALYYSYYSTQSNNIFLSDSYVTDGFYDYSNVYDGLGAPSDTVGDNIAETSFTLGWQTYTVDGIVNPRSSRVFPNGEADLWNPEGVGYKWTPDSSVTTP